MHVVSFGPADWQGEALDRLMGSLDPGDVQTIHVRGGRMTVVLNENPRRRDGPATQRRAMVVER